MSITKDEMMMISSSIYLFLFEQSFKDVTGSDKNEVTSHEFDFKGANERQPILDFRLRQKGKPLLSIDAWESCMDTFKSDYKPCIFDDAAGTYFTGRSQWLRRLEALQGGVILESSITNTLPESWTLRNSTSTDGQRAQVTLGMHKEIGGEKRLLNT